MEHMMLLVTYRMLPGQRDAFLQAILPVIIVYLLLSKFIVRGVALGGVKG